MTSIFLNYLLKKVTKRPITLTLVYKYLRNLSINSTMILFLPFYICRIKSGSVIQTKHFDIKMSLEIRQAKSFFLTLFKNVNIKFDIFSCFYRFAILHNTQPVLLYIFTFRQRNSKAATSASLSRPLFPFLCKLLYLFLE